MFDLSVYSNSILIITGLYISALFACELINNSTTKLFFGLNITAMFSVFWGLRAEDVGSDTKNYILYFEHGDAFDLIDPLIYIFKALVTLISGNSTLFLILISLTINISMFLAYYLLSKRYCMFFGVYASSFLFLNTNINIIRQGLAIGMIALAYAVFLRKKSWKTALYYTISVFGHYSSIVFGLVFIVVKYANIRSVASLIFLLSFTILIFEIDLIILLAQLIPIFEKASWYLGQDFSSWKFKHIYYFLFFAMVLFIFLRMKGHRVKFRNYIEETHFLTLCVGIFLISLLREGEMIADRVFYYFIFIIPLFFGQLLISIVGFKFGYVILYISCLGWIVKSYYFQFNAWFT